MGIEAASLAIADLVRYFNSFLISICQLLALFVISIGVLRALTIFLKESLFKPQTPEVFQNSRLAMGYSFSLGLSFLVGASILKTMISSHWDDIARLVVIIAVRTVLNLLLERAINFGERTRLTPTAATAEPNNGATDEALQPSETVQTS